MNTLRHWPIICLLGLAIFCALVGAACGSDVGDKTDSETSEQTANADQPSSAVYYRSPDFSLIVVPNLESYVEDCGCSGSIRGGLARIASTAKGKRKVFCFVGNTVFSPTQVPFVERDVRQANYQTRKHAYFANIWS